MSRKNRNRRNQTVQHNPVPATPPVANNGPPPAGQPQGAQPAGQHPPPKQAEEFAWTVHGYTNEYIRFADAKRGHTTPADYSAAVTGSTAEQLTDATAQHVHVLAGISKKKYYYVDCCIRLAFIGSGAALIVALFGQ